MPPTLTDVFTPDAFNIYALTAALEKMPHAPAMLRERGIFREIPIATTLVAIEESQGKLTLVPTTPRGGPGIPSQDAKRVVTALKVPHIQLDDTIMADDITNVRAFGADGTVPVGEITGRKLAIMRRSVETTVENLRMHALQGKVFYPDNSVDADLDLFTAFGLTNQATDQQSVDFVFGTDTKKIAADTIPLIRDAIETALGNEPYTGILAFCGRTFFRKLIAQGTVTAAYLQQLAQFQLSQVGMAPGASKRMMFTLGDVTFVEYYGKVGTSAAGPGGNGEFVLGTEGRAIPLGTDLFHTYYAPADTIEAAGTLGLPMYGRPIPREDGKSMGLEVQSNPLSICMRPKCLIRLHTST